VETFFEMYDSDGDGFMTKLDFFEFLYEFEKTYLSDKQVDHCWDAIDKKKAGKVDSDTFCAGVRYLESVEYFADWSG